MLSNESLNKFGNQDALDEVEEVPYGHTFNQKHYSYQEIDE
jgi:hypothetical protein